MERALRVSEESKTTFLVLFICSDILAGVLDADEKRRTFYLRSLHKALFDTKIVIAPDHSVLPKSISRNWDILVENIFRHFFTKTLRLFPICHVPFSFAFLMRKQMSIHIEQMLNPFATGILIQCMMQAYVV